MATRGKEETKNNKEDGARGLIKAGKRKREKKSKREGERVGETRG